MKEGKEQLNEENIRTLGEIETYKYLEIWEADTIKQEEIKEKKIISGEEENYSKTNLIERISLKV